MKQIVEERKDIAFHLIMFPAAHPQAREAIDYALCAKTNEERLKRFETAMDQKPTPKPECKTDTVDRNTAFAREHMINGTPGIFLPDGSKIAGFLEKEQLLEAIDAATKK